MCTFNWTDLYFTKIYEEVTKDWHHHVSPVFSQTINKKVVVEQTLTPTIKDTPIERREGEEEKKKTRNIDFLHQLYTDPHPQNFN